MSSGCGCKEVYIYNYIDFLILLIPTPLVSVLLHPYFFVHFKCFRSCSGTFL